MKGKQVTLRGLELDDVDTILEHWNDLELRQFLGHPFPVSKEEEEQWIRSTWDARKKGSEYTFGIEENNKGLLIGSCGLMSVDSINRTAELGIAIWNKPYWSKGFGTEATQLILSYGFYFINLHSIFLRVHDFNKRAIHVYEKLGFQHVARKRECIFIDGKYHDVLVMDILEDEFRKLYPPKAPFIDSKSESSV
jgi:RimJ/RimL family protein N-acetyltransferase